MYTFLVCHLLFKFGEPEEDLTPVDAVTSGSL